MEIVQTMNYCLELPENVGLVDYPTEWSIVCQYIYILVYNILRLSPPSK